MINKIANLEIEPAQLALAPCSASAVITDVKTGAVKPTGLPSSNVLYYELTDDAWVCVRPSGTEPKVKFYLGVKGTSLDDAEKKSKELSAAVHTMIDAML